MNIMEPLLFNWSSCLETGIQEIDEQHQRIVFFINELYKARFACDTACVDRIIEDLFNEIPVHFSTEEKWMAKHGFDQHELEDHKKAHHAMLELVKLYKERDASMKKAQEMQDLLFMWVHYHIMQEDSKFREFLQK